MKDACVTATEEQIKKEVTASMKYLSMAAFFAKDDVNRPGFAKLFFEAASEEREHATKLIEYLSMRGRYLNTQKNKPTKFNLDISALVRGSEEAKILGVTNIVDLDSAKNADPKTTSGLIALQNALKLEVAVTNSIRNLVKTCEDKFNHYHVSFFKLSPRYSVINFKSHFYSLSITLPENSSTNNTRDNAIWLERLQHSEKWSLVKEPSSESSCSISNFCKFIIVMMHGVSKKERKKHRKSM